MLEKNMKSYRLFGLDLVSEIELPELNASEAVSEPHIIVRYADLGLLKDHEQPSFFFSDQAAKFIYPNVGAFEIQAAQHVFVEPAKGASSNLLSLPLLGPVLGLLLHMKGYFVLHGSAVSIGSNCFGFVGDKGAGKSTTAATLLQLPKAKLLTDDLLAFDSNNKVISAFQQLKISKQVFERSQNLDASLRPIPASDFPKVQVRLESERPSELTELTGVFELRRDSRMRIEDVPMHEAIRLLMRFSYVLRFSTRDMPAEEKKRFFLQVTRLANTGKVKRLYVPDNLDALSKISDLLV